MKIQIKFLLVSFVLFLATVPGSAKSEEARMPAWDGELEKIGLSFETSKRRENSIFIAFKTLSGSAAVDCEYFSFPDAEKAKHNFKDFSMVAQGERPSPFLRWRGKRN